MHNEPPILKKPFFRFKQKGWWKFLPPLFVVCLTGATYFVATNEPVANKQYFPQCGFKKATGLDCPGCGGLRATYAITHGQVIQAFRFHPGFVLSLPIAGYLGIMWIREWRRIGEMPIPLAQHECSRPLIVIAVLFLSFGIIRNIPVKPFTWLATPGADQQAAAE